MPSKRTLLLVGGGLLVVGSLGTLFFAFPKSFTLVRNAYDSIVGWARDRGEQIRRAFRVPLDRLKPLGETGITGMRTSAWNASKLALTNGKFRLRFSRFTSAANAIARGHGVELLIWESARPLERQAALYAIGRTGPGSPVTYTINSRHLYGLAIDFVVRSGNDISFELPRWYVEEVLPLAGTYGLSSLYLREGIDKGHIEVPPAEIPPVVASAGEQLKADFPGLG